MVAPESYIDINVFIYWLGGHPIYGERAFRWIRDIEESRRVRHITSTLTLYEVLVILAGLTNRTLGDNVFVKKVIDAITGLRNLIITPFTIDDVEEATKLMGEYDIDYEDALHLAIALRNKVKNIISNDEDFDKTPLKRLF